jgi:hypothetical protein
MSRISTGVVELLCPSGGMRSSNSNSMHVSICGSFSGYSAALLNDAALLCTIGVAAANVAVRHCCDMLCALPCHKLCAYE